MRALGEYHWPGNVRELENCMERAVILCLGEEITPADLPERLRPERGDEPVPAMAGRSLKEMERELIRATLAETGGNRSEAARVLGISRQTLLNKIRQYGIRETGEP
jgi:two-component system response regulator HydG